MALNLNPMSSTPNELRKDIMTPEEEAAWDLAERQRERNQVMVRVFQIQGELKTTGLSEEIRQTLEDELAAIRSKYNLALYNSDEYVQGAPTPGDLHSRRSTSYPLYQTYGNNPNVVKED